LALEGHTPIGRPFGNTQLLLLDNSGNLLPFGAKGELCIGGLGLARSYLKRPELNEEKFIEIQIAGKTERFYRTGDIGQWLSDGNLAFYGRRDEQVKVRGYRIELGEVEQAALQVEGVGQVVALAKAVRGAEKELLLYYTGKPDATELREHLREKLPLYMIPSYFIQLEAFLLTSHGKINRKILPLPERTGLENARPWLAPDTEIAKTLAAIWAKVLLVEEASLGLYTDFFDCGGNSIKAIRMLNLVQQHWQYQGSVATFFEDSSLGALATSIELWLKGQQTHFQVEIDI
jgi:fengycin family lipopeptide synthetase D/gramicidin S synthase 2/tyrocidine synthetase-2